MQTAQPFAANRYLARHAARLLASLRHWTGRNLVEPGLSPMEQARQLFNVPFAVLSHNTAADPILNYASRRALEIFELSWEELTAMPSRLTAEAAGRSDRARLLSEVTKRGFIDDYRGVRVSKNGRRLLIEQATVWNLFDESGGALRAGGDLQRVALSLISGSIPTVFKGPITKSRSTLALEARLPETKIHGILHGWSF